VTLRGRITKCVSESGDFATLFFFWFGSTRADATIAILLSTLSVLVAIELWTGAQRAFAVKAFYKNGDSFMIA